MTTDHEFLRHTVATVAYRASKALRGAPESYWGYRAGPTSRTPLEILTHMGDLFDWAFSMADGTPAWKDSVSLPWDAEQARFFAAVKKFDDRLASPEEIRYEPRKLFQGPVADALTHTGQLAMLRRMHGAPIKGESYNRADIASGRVGPDQAPPDPKFEFD